MFIFPVSGFPERLDGLGIPGLGDQGLVLSSWHLSLSQTDFQTGRQTGLSSGTDRPC